VCTRSPACLRTTENSGPSRSWHFLILFLSHQLSRFSAPRMGAWSRWFHVPVRLAGPSCPSSRRITRCTPNETDDLRSQDPPLGAVPWVRHGGPAGEVGNITLPPRPEFRPRIPPGTAGRDLGPNPAGVQRGDWFPDLRAGARRSSCLRPLHDVGSLWFAPKRGRSKIWAGPVPTTG